MITTTTFGKHKNVLIAEFGKGDISFAGSRMEDEEFNSMLVFQNSNPHEIGSINSDDSGKTTDELEEIPLIMIFNKAESITALIHSLADLQKQLFRAGK